MDDYLVALQTFGIIGLWLLIFWFSKLIMNLKNGIDAQNNIIGSFKSHSSYLSDVQSTLSNLYDPKEIENIINAKVENSREKDKNSITELVRTFVGMHGQHLRFIGSSLFYLKDEDISKLIEETREYDKDGKLTEFVTELRNNLIEARRKALINALTERNAEKT